MRWLAGLIPSDYFIRKDVSRFKTNNPLLWYLVLLIKNILGYSLIIGGIMMLGVTWSGFIHHNYWINA